MNLRQTLRDNLRSILLAEEILSSNSIPTENDLQILNKFKGFGGLKFLLHDFSIPWNELSKISKQDLQLEEDAKNFYTQLDLKYGPKFKNIVDSIKSSILTSFYTPDYVVDIVMKKTKESGTSISSFLDPSAGSGKYIDTFIKYFPEVEKESIHAVELDFLTSRILKAKYHRSGIVIHQKGFQDVEFSNKFDFIASNIPFGQFKVYYPDYYKISSNITSTIHNFYFYHANELLNEGGHLSFISSSGFFNSKSNKTSREKFLKSNQPSSLLVLPNNIFKKEANTEVTSHLYNGIKNSNKSKQDLTFSNRFITTEKELFLKKDKVDSISLPANDKDLEQLMKEKIEIQMNSYIKQEIDNVFIGNREVKTNPYGEYELASTLEENEIQKELNNKYIVYKTDIKTSFNRMEFLVFEKEPIPFNHTLFQEDPEIQNFMYLRHPDKNIVSKEYKLLAKIYGNYKGKDKLLTTFSRSIDKTTSRPLYCIDSYVSKGSNFDNSKKFLSSKDFKTNYDVYIEDLENIVNDHSILIRIDSVNEEFKQYFENTFKQPVLKYEYFRLDFKKEEYPYISNWEKPHLFYNSQKNLSVNSSLEQITNQGEQKTYIKSQTIDLDEPRLEQLKNVVLIRDSYYNLLNQIEDADSIKIKLARKELNYYYDKYVSKYGFLNGEKSYFVEDYESVFPQLKGIENKSDKEYKKSDIFNEDYGVQHFKVETIKDAFFKTLNEKFYPDVSYMAELLGREEGFILEGLKNTIIFDPISDRYELRSDFLSGDILEKIHQVENIYATTPSLENKKSLDALYEAMPEKVPFEDITINFGARWVPTSIYNSFLEYKYNSDISLNFNEKTGNLATYKGTALSDDFKKDSFTTLGSRFITPIHLIKNAFEDQYPIYKYKINDVSHTDKESTRKARKIIDLIKSDFHLYLKDSLEDSKKQELENLYNSKFNTIVLNKVDGSWLEFNDVNFKALGFEKFHSHQKNAVWKIVKDNGGIIDHEVGLGKTMTMILASYLMKKTGKVKKPIITALKANVSEIAEKYQLAYPDAKILFARASDFQKKNRQVFLNSIKNNDWDCVIMSHEQFSSIPQSLEVSLKILKRELDEIDENLRELKGYDISKQQKRALESSKKNKEARQKQLLATLEKNKDDGVLYFDQLGIDHILIDESHMFKNLGFETKHSRVAGLGNTIGSQRAKNLLVALRTLQDKNDKKEMGATFLSGTPISNSLTELYVLFKYFIPKTLERQGIYNFDSWASNFAQKTTEFESNMVNEIVAKERFRYYQNMPELSLMYSMISDVARADKVGIDRPSLKQELLTNDQSKLQKRFYKKIAYFLRTSDPSKLKLDKPINMGEKGTAKSLIAMNLAFKASLDMRLIRSSLKDDPNSKINTVVRKVLDTYYEFNKQKGTQILFCDMSTPKGKNKSFDELEENYKNGVFTNLYDDIKYKLIASGIKENEIAFIHDYNTEKKKIILNRQMNNGIIRVLLGSTSKAGTGLNVQKRLARVYDITLGWKPSDLDQRHGRIQRTGNWIIKEYANNEAIAYISATNHTLDAFKFDLLKNKANFIDQIRNANNSIRVIDEGVLNENTGMDLAEFHAQITGDDTLLKKSKAEKLLKELEEDKSMIEKEVRKSKNRMEFIENKIQKNLNHIDLLIEHKNFLEGKIELDKKGVRINQIKFNKDLSLPIFDFKKEDGSIDENKNITETLKVLNKRKFNISTISIGTLYGFELYMESNLWGNKNYYAKRYEYPSGFTEGETIQFRDNPNEIKYTHNDGIINFHNSDSSVARYFLTAITKQDQLIKNTQSKIKDYQEEFKVCEIKSNQTFDKQDLLLKTMEECESLEKKLEENNSRFDHLVPGEITLDG